MDQFHFNTARISRAVGDNTGEIVGKTILSRLPTVHFHSFTELLTLKCHTELNYNLIILMQILNGRQ